MCADSCSVSVKHSLDLADSVQRICPYESQEEQKQGLYNSLPNICDGLQQLKIASRLVMMLIIDESSTHCQPEEHTRHRKTAR